ncbi:MAG: hypothetical protein WD851_02610 [Pirellulales bacterium]
MHARSTPLWLAFGVALFALPLVGGCAADRLPRIDPSGESFFVWPGQQPAVANPFAPGPALPLASAGNVVAPPVYSDMANPGTFAPPPAAFPAVAAVPGATTTPLSPPNVMGTTVAASAPGPQDTLTLNPNRVLAPVGSEVILRAGVCSSSGYYIVNQRVEWMIDRAGPGQIVTIGERGHLDMFRCPQNTPRKVDNWYAIGATIPYHICLDRGTADPADDLQIRPGEAWVSISSATEGTSYVTAYSPAVGNWPGRTARATIIWVDAQWQFPPSVTLPGGQPHVLTTTVTRQSDGAPVGGYIVRYEVVGGRASLGYDAGQASEMPTDSQGRARVEITPTDSAPGSTTVNIQIIRPEQPGAAAGPRVTLGSGSTTLTWAGGGASPIPQLPAGQVPPPASQPPQPLPFVPPQLEPTAPPLGATPTGRPQLEVTVTRETPDPLKVNDNVRFLVKVRNTGTAPARNIVVASDFDPGLSHLQAKAGENRVEYKGMGELAAGESDSVPLSFTITKPGEQCQRVTVSAEGATDAVDRGCVNVVAAAPAAERPTLRVEITGERIKTVNDFTDFNTVVENTGTVPATNLVVDISKDGEFLQWSDADRDLTRQPDDTMRVLIPELAPSAKRNFQIRCKCTAPSTRACAQINVTGDDVRYSAEHCIEVRPPLGPPGPGGATAGPANLRLTLLENANSAKVGFPAQLFVIVDNTGVSPERQVAVRVFVPTNFTVDTTAIQPRGNFQVVNRPDGLELQFTPIAELRANEQQRYMIPLTPARAGVAVVTAQVQSQSVTEPISKQREITIIDR